MVFRLLLRNWLQQTAREKLHDTVAEASRRQAASTATNAQGKQAAELPPCHVGVVFALSIESGGLEDLLSGVLTTHGHGFAVKQGGLEKRGVVLIEAGAGLEAAARATEALIAGHHPRWIISAGFAGGLAPQVKRFDIVVADSLVQEKGERLTVDLNVDPASLAEKPGVYVGPVLTVDRVVRLPAQKRALGETCQALAVDMESCAIAEVCRQRRVRFLAVRVITDPLDEQLPNDIEQLLRQKTNLSRFGAAMGAVWQRPGSFKDMYQLRENSLIASDRLAKFLAATIQQLPPATAEEIPPP